MNISSNIRFYRKKANLTQIELANDLGISIATLRRWEAGETTPTGAKIQELAKILNVNPEELIKEENKTSTRNESGMLIFENGNFHIELPPTEKGYEIFNQLVKTLIK